MKKLLVSALVLGAIFGARITVSAEQQAPTIVKVEQPPYLVQSILESAKEGYKNIEPNKKLFQKKWGKVLLLWGNHIVSKFGTGLGIGLIIALLKDHKVLPEVENYFGKIFWGTFFAAIPGVLSSDKIYDWALGNTINKHVIDDITFYLSTKAELAQQLNVLTKINDSQQKVDTAKVENIPLLNKDSGRVLAYAGAAAATIATLVAWNKIKTVSFKNMIPFLKRA